MDELFRSHGGVHAAVVQVHHGNLRWHVDSCSSVIIGSNCAANVQLSQGLPGSCVRLWRNGQANLDAELVALTCRTFVDALCFGRVQHILLFLSFSSWWTIVGYTSCSRTPDGAAACGLAAGSAWRARAQGGRARRDQCGHGLPHREGSAAAVREAGDSGELPSRPAGRNLRQQGGTAAPGRARHTAGGGAPGDVVPPPGAHAQRAAHLSHAALSMARIATSSSARCKSPAA